MNVNESNTHRSKTRPVRVGNLTIGGSDELFIQSMTTTKTHDVEATVAEILRLEEAGFKSSVLHVRMNVRPIQLVKLKSGLIFHSSSIFILIINLRLIAIEQGADKIRINPGNIGRQA